MRSYPVIDARETVEKAELFDALNIMLEEAGSRRTPEEAASVIAGVLSRLSRTTPELTTTTRLWINLLAAQPSQESV